MPTLKQSLHPIDLTGLQPAEPAASNPAQPTLTRPVMPSNEPGPNPFLRTTLPAKFGLQPDTLRQFHNPATVQFRNVPLSDTADPVIGAVAVSAAKQAIAASTVTDTDPYLLFRGVWQSFTNYTINDVVIFNGSAYVAIAANVGKQPDINHDSGIAEGAQIGSAVWTLLSENFVFGANPSGGLAVGGYGAFDTMASGTGSGTSGSITAVASNANEIALLWVNNANGFAGSAAGFQFFSNATNSGGGNSQQLFYKIINSSGPVTANLNFSGSTTWAACLQLFQFGGFQTFTITQVAISNNVATITAANTLVAGNIVVFSGLTNATFLNGLAVHVQSATSSSFTINFTHAGYGPTSDTGTVSLAALQDSSEVSGAWFPPNGVTFGQAVSKNSIFVFVLATADTSGSPTISSASDTIGNSYSVNNANRAGRTASIAFSSRNTTAGGTPTVTANGSSGTSAGWWIVELPGSAGSLKYQPYDVFEFRGSFYLCLKETSQDAFADPTSWGQVAQGTGSVVSITS